MLLPIEFEMAMSAVPRLVIIIVAITLSNRIHGLNNYVHHTVAYNTYSGRLVPNAKIVKPATLSGMSIVKAENFNF